MFGSFLNSLPSRVNSAVSGLFNKVKSSVSNVFRGGQTASAGLDFNAFNVLPGTSTEQIAEGAKQFYESGPNAQVVVGPGGVFGQTTGSAGNVLAPQSTLSPSEAARLRSDVSQGKGAFGSDTSKSSSQSEGVRFDPQLGTYVPDYKSVGGATGVTPETTFNNLFTSRNFDPVTGQTSFSVPGVSGLAGGGGSSFTGLLSGASGAGTPSLRGTSVDEERGKTRTVSTPEELQNFGFNMFLDPVTGQLKKPLPAGVQPQLDQEIDVSNLGGQPSNVLSSTIADGVDDRTETNLAISERYQEALNTQTIAGQGAASLDTAVSRDLLDIVDSAPFDVAGAMEEAIAGSGITQFQEQRVEALKALNATVEAYQSIADDIKQNPDLPRGLAQRRLQQLAEQQKNATNQLLGTLEVLDAQIDDINFGLERQFGIIRTRAEQEESRREKAESRIRENLNLLIDSGAIAGMSDFELEQWSELSGLDVRALEKMRESALEPKYNIITNEFADGSLKGIDKNTGKTVWSIPGAAGGKGGVTTSAGFANSNIEAELRGFVSDLYEEGSTMDKAYLLARGNFSGGEVTDNAIKSVMEQFYGSSIETTLDEEGALPGEEGGASLAEIFQSVGPQNTFSGIGIGPFSLGSIFNKITGR